ncbi:hypothetical protein [Ligilactobacillus equi]|uniref:Polysaccharide polymerase n=1 Tax=Ligilactobacillus equi DPC 6820 TaxID=1392007 RepID=V7HW58_9LACO|nr:hypothetical protein [Ligilactobacillus equi]ETA74474.1 hypothetical protein LEQ_1597c [Ligilactobacillus equi DPC 6820]
MRIKRNNILLLLISIFLLTDNKVFYLFTFGGTFDNKLYSGLLAIIVGIILFFTSKHVQIGEYGSAIIFIYILLLVQAYYEKINYHFSNNAILFILVNFGILVIYFGLLAFLNEEQSNFDNFVTILEVIGTILGVILLIQHFVILKTGHTLFSFHDNIYDTLNRSNLTDGRFYVVAEGLIRMLPLVSLYSILVRNTLTYMKALGYLSFVVSLLAIYFVDQSRVYMLTEFLTCIIMFISFNFDYHKISKQTFFRIFYVLLALIIAFYTKGQSLLVTLSDTDNGSNYARTGAVEYYLRVSKDYLLTGIGTVIPSPGSRYYWLVRGPLGIYHYSDVGFIGILASLGIFGLLIYLYIVAKNFILTVKIKNRSLHSLAVGCSWLMLLSSLTLSYFDIGRIVSLLLTMVIINICYLYDIQNSSSCESLVASSINFNDNER